MWCKLCNLFQETQQHLLECPELKIRTKNIINFKEVDHDMVFGNVKNQEKVAKVYTILIEARKDILDQLKTQENSFFMDEDQSTSCG